MASFTRKSIMDAFMKLVDERPVHKISVRDIVEECGVNRNTFYYHFQDIPDLVETIVKEQTDQIILESGGVSSMEECLRAAMKLCEAQKRALLHIYNSANRDIYERYLLNICEYAATRFVDHMTEGKPIRPDDRAAIIQSYKCECFGQITDWLRQGMNRDLETQFLRLCELRRGSTEEMIRRSLNS